MSSYYCTCGTPPSGAEVPGQACGGCGGIIVEYCDCEKPELIEDGPTSICAGCGNVVRDDSPDPQEARIRELEQELATANSLCRIAQGKVVAQSGMLKEAEDIACNAVGDLETADNCIMELEEKRQPNKRTCPMCHGTPHTIKYYSSNKHPTCIHQGDNILHECKIIGCPSHEHMHFICCRCKYECWEPCPEHVKSPSTCEACGADFDLIAITQSSDRGLCPKCWLRGVKVASEEEQP